jgi:hypothetical protein
MFHCSVHATDGQQLEAANAASSRPLVVSIFPTSTIWYAHKFQYEYRNMGTVFQKRQVQNVKDQQH